MGSSTIRRAHGKLGDDAEDASRTDEPVGTEPARGRSAGGPGLPLVAEGSGAPVIALIAAIGLFLLWRAMPALARNEVELLPQYGAGSPPTLGDAFRCARPVPGHRVRVAVRAGAGDAGGAGHRDLPDAVRTPALAGPLAYMVDLLAAVPSIIYGVWGLFVLAPWLRADRVVAQREPRLDSSCSPTATPRWPAAARSSPPASCWR